VAVAITSLDKAAEKGVIHPNNAARRKSRLMKKLNEAQAATSA
jgi:small subunit ribosomal protein S20